jgi:hypothetical protein
MSITNANTATKTMERNTNFVIRYSFLRGRICQSGRRYPLKLKPCDQHGRDRDDFLFQPLDRNLAALDAKSDRDPRRKPIGRADSGGGKSIEISPEIA